MANPIHGKVILADFGGTTATNLINWSCRLGCDTAESTVAHATNYGKMRLSGFSFGTATIICRLAGDEQYTQGQAGTLNLYRGASTTSGGYSGSAFCIGSTKSTAMGDVETIQYDFSWNGAVASL